ncbi:MAG: elongation factor G [Planctomycetota bacterium]
MKVKQRNRIELLRNVGIAAHIDAGKTTLTERMLYYAGRIHCMRDVRGGDGGATMDSDPIEKRRGITISSAATHLGWNDHQVNIVDTPGHVDFTVEVERSLRVLDGAVMVLCSVGGVQSQTMTVDRQMHRYSVPRVALINKMDRAGANPRRVIDQLRERLNATPIALQLPIGNAETFSGVVDLVTMKAVSFDGEDGSKVVRSELPNELRQEASSARAEMIESLSLLDESILETVFSGESPSQDELRRSIRELTLRREMTPVLFASAYKNLGVQEVLDAVTYYLPAPCDRKVQANDHRKQQGTSPAKIELSPDENAAAVAMAFKTVVEKFGQLTFLRVYQGRIEKGATLRSTRTGKAIRFGRLVRLHADKREDVDSASAGDIVGVVGVQCASGETFTAQGLNVSLERIVAAPPVMRLSIAPERREDADKLGRALDRFRRQDPTFHVLSDPDTGETIIAGMGQLHLEVYVERLKDECDCPCLVGKPSVTYRERPTRAVDFEHTYKKQNGGPGSYARISGRFEPLAADAQEKFVFESDVSGGRVSTRFVSAVRDGIAEALTNGPLDGYQMVGVRVTLKDGKEHESDSSELAFQICGNEAVRKVIFPQCASMLLEPVMEMEIEFPEEFHGSVNGHLARLRGVVTSSESDGVQCKLVANAPLAELFDYASELRSITQGKGCFTMKPHDYQPAPTSVSAG